MSIREIGSRVDVAALPATCLNGFLGHIGDMRAGVVAQQKNSMLLIMFFLLNTVLSRSIC